MATNTEVIVEDNMISLMRRLATDHGVTHFVVDDDAYAKLVDRQNARNIAINPEVPPVTDDMGLLFRNRRVLRLKDLKHLPFECGPLSPR